MTRRRFTMSPSWLLTALAGVFSAAAWINPSISRAQPPNPQTASQSSSSQPARTSPGHDLVPGDKDPLNVTDAERDALAFTAYDLDLHLTPASAGISVRAGLTVRNDGATPLSRLVFQITSSMHWEAFSSLQPVASTTTSSVQPLPFIARRVATDTDHTGWAQEAVVTLPQPLPPGTSISLTAFYSGAIPPSAERLERIGAPAVQAASADWDAIAAGNPLTAAGSNAPPGITAVRGFGNVLWYPVAASPVFLGDGAKLFQAIGRARQRQSAATVRLRLAIEFTGDAPGDAFFCGRREPLAAIRDNPELPVAVSPGVATAAFDWQPLGFRTPSLFVTGHPSTAVGPPASPDLIAAVTDNFDALPSYSAAAALVEPLLSGWLGTKPSATLNLLDHPGQPFEDNTLLVRPMSVEAPDTLAPSLAHSLTHAWIHSSHPWIDQGIPQFMGLLWTEHTLGRTAALNQLQDDAHTLALAAATPSDTSATSAQSLIDATSEVYYRTKAAAVFWMLRDIAGEDSLKQALQAYRLDPKLDADPSAFEHTLEKFAHKDLRWFFDDWVYRDRGLPDLSIVNVTPRELEAHNGLPTGWLVSIDVRNDGDAEAEVPITVRSAPGLRGAAAATATDRLRIPPHSSVSHRILFPVTPAEVQVNDGGVPEIGAAIHTRQLVLPAK